MKVEQREYGYTGVSGDIIPLPLPESFTEPADREPICPFEPTPPDPYYHEVAAHQRLVDDSFYGLIHEHAPAYIPQEVRDMVELDYLAGSAQRHIKNAQAYREWSAQNMPLTPELEAINHEISLGTVQPTNNLYFIKQTNINSGELTRVFHPYGYRMQHVSSARVATRQGIEANDGVVYPPVLATYRKINIQPNMNFSNGCISGFLVTYKRDVGHVTRDDGRRIQVIERQSAAIRIDRLSGMDSDMRSALHSVGGIGKVKGWENALVHGTGFDKFLTDKIQHDTLDSFLIPLSTMSYAAVESEEQYETRQNEQRAYGRPAVKRALSNQDDMVFIGHS